MGLRDVARPYHHQLSQLGEERPVGAVTNGVRGRGARQPKDILHVRRLGIDVQRLAPLELFKLDAALLSMPRTFSPEDSRQAARLMVAGGARCLVTLGGDGTNRMVSKASGDVPLMPISTGTNNVFPHMIEASIAGLAAGLVACGHAHDAVHRAPRCTRATKAKPGDRL